MIFEAEQGVYLVDQLCNALDLITDLIRSHEDMGIILGEAAYTHKTVKLTGFLMTMNEYQAHPYEAADHGRNAARKRKPERRPGSSSV